jgi:hypothetical protein
MSRPDIEVLDDAQAYPYSNEIEVLNQRIGIGDLIARYLDSTSTSVSFWERVYGFNFPGIHTHVIDGAVPAEFHSWEYFAEKFENGNFVVLRQGPKEAYQRDENTIKTLTYYRHVHDDGWQSIVVTEKRHPLERTPFDQSVSVYDTIEKMVEDLYDPEELADHHEAKSIYEFITSTDAGPSDLRDPDELPTSNQSDLGSY